MSRSIRTVLDRARFDRVRVEWAVSRYDFWLDLRFVPRRERKQLRRELRANLLDAASTVGAGPALAGVGSPRVLASATPIGGESIPRWTAGAMAALVAAVGTSVIFALLGLYYVEGVLDSGATGQFSSSLFPFFGSRMVVDNTGPGFSMEFHPGYLPLVAAAVALLGVARPRRGFRGGKSRSDELTAETVG